MKNIKKLIVIGMMSASVLALNPTIAHAEWKQDNTGWWFTEGDNSWATGWRQIDNKWYYFNNNGYMVTNTTINGYKIDNNGVWVQNTVTTNNSNNTTTTNLNSNNVTNTSLVSNSNNSMNSNNTTNLTNLTSNINNGVIINGDVSIGNTSNSNNTQQNSSNNQVNSNDNNKTEPIIEGNFTDKENNIFPCWAIIDGKYYHLDGDKQIDYDTTIDGYKIGADGAWIQDNSVTPPNAIVLPYGFQLSAKQVIEKLQMNSKNDEIKQDTRLEKHEARTAKIKELQDKITDIQNKHINNGDYWIQIYQNEIKELQLEDQNNN